MPEWGSREYHFTTLRKMAGIDRKIDETTARTHDPGSEGDAPRRAAMNAVLEKLIVQETWTLETMAKCPDAAQRGWHQRLNNMEWSRPGVAAELQRLLRDVVDRKNELLLGPLAAAAEQTADPPSEAPYAALPAAWAPENEQQEPFGRDRLGLVVSVESSLRKLVSALADYETLWH
jgi:hypothetical protein